MIPNVVDPGLGGGELFGALLESRLNQGFQVLYVFNETGLGDGFFDLLPDSFDRIQIGRVRRQVHQHDLQVFGRLLDKRSQMGRVVVPDEDDGLGLGVGLPDLREHFDNVFLVAFAPT